MRGRAGLLLMTAVVGTPAPSIAEPAASQTALDLTFDDRVLAISINNMPFRLAVVLNDSQQVVLNPAAFNRLGKVTVGPHVIDLGSAQFRGVESWARIGVGGKTVIARVTAIQRNCCRRSDGTIAADLLPYDAVHFRRPNAAAGVATHSARADRDYLLGMWLPIKSQAGTLRLKIDLERETSIATYSAGYRMAALGGGRLSGDPRMAISFYDYATPVRRLVLDRPVSLAPFVIGAIDVRMSDFRGRGQFPAMTGSTDDIVVARKLQAAKGRDLPNIHVGRDFLRRCSSLSYYRRDDRLDLTCD